MIKFVELFVQHEFLFGQRVQVHFQGFCLLRIVLRLLAPQARKGCLQTLRDALATGIFFDERLQMFRLLLLALIALLLCAHLVAKLADLLTVGRGALTQLNRL